MFKVSHTILQKPQLSTRSNDYPVSSFTSLNFARASPFLSLMASKGCFYYFQYVFPISGSSLSANRSVQISQLVISFGFPGISYLSMIRYYATNKAMSPLAKISDEKVIVMICGPCFLPSERDEAIFAQTVGSALRDTGKGFIVWVKDNQIDVEPDVLLQMILSRPTSSFENTEPKTSYDSDFSSPTKPAQATAANVSVDRGRRTEETPHDPLPFETNVDQLQNASMQPSATPGRIEYVPPKGEYVMVKTRLFSGVLSDQHVEIWYPGFIVPDYVNDSLYQDYANTPDAVVKIIQDKDGKLRWLVDLKTKSRTSQKQDSPAVPGDEYFINLKANETVVLITRVRYGQISLEEGDVRVYQQNWKIPDYLKKSLLRDYKSIANGELYVISDENKKLRFKVFEEKGRIASGFHKAGKIFRETFTFK